MTTERQMTRFLTSLWGRDAGVKIFDRTLCMRPVRHFACAIYFDRTSSKEKFQPVMGIQFLARSPNAGLIGYGRRFHSPLHGAWDITHPDITTELRAVVEALVLPLFRTVETLDDFIAYANDPTLHLSLDYVIWERAIVDAARGDFIAAQAGLERFMVRGRQDSGPVFSYAIDALYPLIAARDAAAVAALLHATEAANARRLGIDDIWEPSPFPVETAILRS